MICSFLKADGSQIQLLVQSQDYLHIPAGIEHWCISTGLLHLKAVRYFSAADGWLPNYTGTQLSDFWHQA